MKKRIEIILLALWIVIMGINAFIVFGQPTKSNSEKPGVQILNDGGTQVAIATNTTTLPTGTMVPIQLDKPSSSPVEPTTSQPVQTQPPNTPEPVSTSKPVSEPTISPVTTTKPESTPVVTQKPTPVVTPKPVPVVTPQPEPTPISIPTKPLPTTDPVIADPIPEGNENSKSLNSIVNDLLGTKYAWGGTSANGFDASGFVQTVLSKLKIQVPRTTALMRQLGKDVFNAVDLQVADLVFFCNNDQDTKGSHVGVSLGNNKVAIVTINKGVTIIDLSQTYWKDHFVIGKKLQ
jgi:cell wall-associated NlpC family hydrolase